MVTAETLKAQRKAREILRCAQDDDACCLVNNADDREENPGAQSRSPSCCGQAYATNSSHGAGGRSGGVGNGFGADAEDFALVGFDNLEAEAVGVYHFARPGDVAGYTIEQAGDGGGGGMLHVGIELHAEEFADFFELHAASNYQGAAGFANYVWRGPAVFFADFADDLFY